MKQVSRGYFGRTRVMDVRDDPAPDGPRCLQCEAFAQRIYDLDLLILRASAEGWSPRRLRQARAALDGATLADA
jgi:hypothetical protein